MCRNVCGTAEVLKVQFGIRIGSKISLAKVLQKVDLLALENKKKQLGLVGLHFFLKSQHSQILVIEHDSEFWPVSWTWSDVTVSPRVLSLIFFVCTYGGVSGGKFSLLQISWASGRGLLEVYEGWTDAASAGHLEEGYQKFIGGGQMQPQLGIRKRFIRSLSGVDRCSLSW